jgi:GT2 family glycosyltransferase
LDRLADLKAPAGGLEVVVVDDGSPAADGVADLLAERAATFPVPLRWASLPVNSGRAAARNAAWRKAAGDWVAFTDDDCRPDPRWLHNLLEAAESSNADVVQGSVTPDPSREALLSDPRARSLRVPSFSGYYETANILYRRDVLKQLGGFDESFPGAGEDTDLGWRAKEAGYGASFAADAVVVHDVVVRRFSEDLRDRRRWGDVVRVVKLHPEIRALAWTPYIFRRSHVTPLLVMGGLPLALLGRRVRAAYAAAVIVGVLRQTKSVPRLVLLVGDFYETAVLIRSSMRERTVML